MTLCRSLHAEVLQTTVSEGLAQGPYMAARAGFEPMTLRLKGIDSTNAPPRPTNCYANCSRIVLAINICNCSKIVLASNILHNCYSKDNANNYF